MAKVQNIRNGRTPEQWAEIIQSKWQDNTKGILEVGGLLANAREELEPAVFWKMVRERLRYADSTVKQFCRIGTDVKLMEVAMATLPACWRTLYALACLTDEQFQRGLDTGVIHAGMERKDIALLKPPKAPPAPEPALTGRELIERRAYQTWEHIHSVLRELNPAEQTDYIEMVRFSLDELAKKRAAA